MVDPWYFRALEQRCRDFAAESSCSTARESWLTMAEDYATRADWTEITGTLLGVGTHYFGADGKPAQNLM
jgi:hypothetical protein